MRCAHTVEQVRAAEAEAFAVTAEGELMQRAATGLAHAAIRFLGGAVGRRVLLLVGSGDNGGDTLWAGARLCRRGASVEAVLLAPDHTHAEGLAAFRAAGGRLRTPESLPGTRPPEAVLDGIVGIGGRGPLRPAAAAAVEALAEAPFIAVDVPSGIGVDTGELSGPHVTAAVTVTFGTHKIAQLVDPAAAACGRVELVDIGLDPPPAPVEALEAADVARLLPRPAAAGHKYSRGVVGLRTGSAAYPGAALLTAAGASCGLAGMIRYDGPVADLVRTAWPEVVAGSGRVQAWVVGSGREPDAATSAALSDCLADAVPTVVDAGALAGFGGGATAPVVLTPHAGELAGMLGVPRDEIEASPLAHARLAAVRYGAVVLLKGRRTLIARPADDAAGADEADVRVNTTGVPWLGTAGAGDVLAGLIGALLACGMTAWDAASVGAWLHGEAAARALRESGPPVAGRVAASLPGLVGELLMGFDES